MKLIKQNKIKLIISSILILLPLAVGLILYGTVGDPTSPLWQSMLFPTVFLPLFLLAMHWVCMIVSAKDFEKNEQHEKIVGISFWICPVISLLSSTMFIFLLNDVQLNLSLLIGIVFGASFLLFGNYLPKCRKSYTVGIKVVWAYSSEENWSATHRFAGKLWFVGGILMFILALLPVEIFIFVALALILVLCVVPTVYSYRFYKKELREGKITAITKTRLDKRGKTHLIAGIIVTAAVLLLCFLLLFSGKFEVTLGDTALTVDASVVGDVTLNYADIDSVEYRENGVDGIRISGFASAKLHLGWFQNKEFGNYTRYTYVKSKPCIVIKADGETVVVNCLDPTDTEALYNELVKKTA